ncbi:uncharacterized protein EDB91DRAFT_1297671 [Suillus paluster]|uniref:uncharacterized protein n=1 Tax=Suillus paluster TaxID=48578 RepID=UPI001B877F7D|nr:uncharacterized protein EDB91DRAFT_1297671 [Suillus paluster]KAG1751271.1 hypothetical protein EDB91DRAFT_1297671 [Suillus paluster]
MNHSSRFHYRMNWDPRLRHICDHRLLADNVTIGNVHLLYAAVIVLIVHIHLRKFSGVRSSHMNVVVMQEIITFFAGGRNGKISLTFGLRLLNGLWRTRDQYNKEWVLDMYRPRFSPPVTIDDYFYLNIRTDSHGEKSSLVFSNFSPVLDSFLRTVFVDDKRLEYPIHRLFQKIKALQSRLDDARNILGGEQVPEDLTSKAELFGFNTSSGCEAAVQYLTDLVTHLGKLLEVVEAECKQTVKQFEESLSNNQISFDLLEYYYEEGAWYTYNFGSNFKDVDVERRIIVGALKRACFSDEKESLALEIESFGWDGVGFQKRTDTLVQEAYQGTREISSLFLQRTTDETLVKVTERGRLYLSYSRVWHAVYYDDTRTLDPLWCGDNTVQPRMRRVMIDPVGFHRAQSGHNANLRMPLPDNVEEYVARLPYSIGGYDLEAREWRTFRMWDLKPVESDQEAWRKLVMDENTKDLIRALVDTTGRSLGLPQPVQLSKGKNVLLTGSLGTGRMTAVHAVCNLFKRPLLAISARDFPGNKLDLVPHIAGYMSLAATWNAVIVVKDADVFLKSAFLRDRDSINAAFRQFESDDCITFWVTTICDKDLLRSFTAVVEFPELDAAARRRLWLSHFGRDEPARILSNNSERTLTSSSSGDQKKADYLAHVRDIEKLSWYQFDGRMIENIMVSARALAASNQEHLSTHHVKVVIKAQRLDNLPLWRKLTQFLTLPVKVLRTSVVN